MRKILIIVIMILLIVVGYLMAFQGLNVFGSDILSISEIKNKNEELDTKLQQISTLTSVEQPKAMSELNDSSKQLLIAKEAYNDMVLYSTSENIEEATYTRPYETEYLWTRLGNHAKKNSINLRYELRAASTGVSQQYDIYFTVTGSYVSVSEFVTSLENDTSLNFQIENFKLIPGGSGGTAQTNNNTENTQHAENTENAQNTENSGNSGNSGNANNASSGSDVLQATFVVREITVKLNNTGSTEDNIQ